jgi:bacterial translation initiation factor 3 (bIF-3)
VSLRFRGREITHQDIGMRVLERVKADVEDVGQVEQMPKLEGRQMIMVISPKKKNKQPLLRWFKWSWCSEGEKCVPAFWR